MRLEADINFTDMQSPYPEKTLYFEIDKKYGYMLNDDSYDAFVLVPLYLAMLHKQDLYIRGKISKKLYQNIKWYIQKIFCDFHDELSPVNFLVDGFTSPPKKRGKLIGTGISCGVDSLCTIYDHFVKENDPDYKINALFYFNCGHYGYYTEPKWRECVLQRAEAGKNAAKEIGLPYYFLDTNLHSFRTVWQDIIRQAFICVYSCVFSMENFISKFYSSTGASYEESKKYTNHYHNLDMAVFCETYLVPLIQTEKTNLVSDGGQYRRVDKLKNIVDWEISKKYLNVCGNYTPDGSNCSFCEKCMRTLLPLEIMGKLDDYKNVFDMEQYEKNSLGYKIHCLQHYNEAPFETENVDFARENNFPMPTKRECFVLGNQATII